MKTRYTLLFVCFIGTLLISSCKTKQELVEENKFQKEIDKRGNELAELADQVGLESDASSELVDQINGVDNELMNFLATDPNNELRSKMLNEFLARREGIIRGSMTKEQYLAYRKAVLARSQKKAAEAGKPLNINPDN